MSGRSVDHDCERNPSGALTLSPGRLAQIACLLEVNALKPGNVHRHSDLPDLGFFDFLLSAAAIVAPLDRALTEGVGRAVRGAIEATRQVVATNTNLGIVLLLAPMAAVPESSDLAQGIEKVLAATNVEDARDVFHAIRLAQPGGLGEVADQDVRDEPTIPLRAIMRLAAERDLIARQYVNGFHDILSDALPALRESLDAGWPLTTAVVSCYLSVLAHHHDSLIARKHGPGLAHEVSLRAAALVDAGWPECEEAQARLETFDFWLRQPAQRINPGTTADLVTAALYAGLREQVIPLPLTGRFKV